MWSQLIIFVELITCIKLEQTTVWCIGFEDEPAQCFTECALDLNKKKTDKQNIMHLTLFMEAHATFLNVYYMVNELTVLTWNQVLQVQNCPRWMSILLRICCPGYVLCRMCFAAT